MKLKIKHNELRNLIRESVMEAIAEAESGGWVVDTNEAQEAYNLAAQTWGEEEINRQIVRAMGERALSECLAYIFRMNDFREWEEGNEKDFTSMNVNASRVFASLSSISSASKFVTHTAYGYPQAEATAASDAEDAAVGIPPTVSCASLLITICTRFFGCRLPMTASGKVRLGELKEIAAKNAADEDGLKAVGTTGNYLKAIH